MGLPAHQLAPRRRAAAPALTVVRRPRAARVSSARSDQRCREAFNLACVLMLALTLFALGRVMLSAKAAETAIDSGAIMDDIKAERLEGDLLEVDMSALKTPSRIEFIAGQTLDMSQAPDVSYMDLSSADLDPGPGEAVASADAARMSEADAGVSSGAAGMLASVLEMAAGEARVLLVGDAGLASAR